MPPHLNSIVHKKLYFYRKIPLNLLHSVLKLHLLNHFFKKKVTAIWFPSQFAMSLPTVHYCAFYHHNTKLTAILFWEKIYKPVIFSFKCRKLRCFHLQKYNILCAIVFKWWGIGSRSGRYSLAGGGFIWTVTVKCIGVN